MNKIYVLDCTLRDGGYINDWRFGDDNSKELVELISTSGVDVVELAFIKNCQYEGDKMEFNDMGQITRLFRPSSHKLSAMVEIGYGYPVTSFPERSADTVDMIRLVVWKRMIKESFEYAKQLIRKGYEVGIQATRIEQYRPEEFADFVKLFTQLKPKGIYIVDTFGLLTKQRLLEYATIADQYLTDEVCMGYHAHNNMQQAFSNMVAITEHPWNHPLMIDASIMGMGRGAGNLSLELLEKYLNESFNGNFNLEPLYKAADRYILPIFNNQTWGYSIPYLLSAQNGRNPSYVNYFLNKGLNCEQMSFLFTEMKRNDIGIVYDTQEVDDMISCLFHEK